MSNGGGSWKTAWVIAFSLIIGVRVAEAIPPLSMMPLTDAASGTGTVHGVLMGMWCAGPTCVGSALDCSIAVGYADGFRDTIEVQQAWSVVDPLGDAMRVPAVGNLPIAEVHGNTTCVVGGSLPCFICAGNQPCGGAPALSEEPGMVVFRQNEYIVQPDDLAPLSSQGAIVVQDLCDSPMTESCSMLPSVLQFTAATEVWPAQQVIAEHSANVDPTTEGWTLDIVQPGFANGPIESDFGYVESWNLATIASNADVAYRFSLSDQQVATALAEGWSLTVALRVINANGTGLRLLFRTGAKIIGMVVTRDHQSDDLFVRLETSIVRVDGDADAYHVFHMTDDDADGLVDLYVNGVLVVQDEAIAPFSYSQGIIFGDLVGGAPENSNANYALVRFATNPCDLTYGCRGSEIDCNGDGVLDPCESHAQDCNHNAIPDECEMEEDCNDNGVLDECDLADATTWTRSPGNGHFYRLSNAATTWVDAEEEAMRAGGHLATIRGPDEEDWIAATFRDAVAPDYALRIGLYQQPGAKGDDDDWFWSSGEPMSYIHWCPLEPNGSDFENFGMFFFYPVPIYDRCWIDVSDDPGQTRGVIERIASPSWDCNANAVPDECDAEIPADFDNDGDVDLLDVNSFANCMSSPDDATLAANCPELCRRVFDLEAGDSDVDLADFARVQSAFTGNNE